MPPKLTDINNQRYGNLIVLGEIDRKDGLRRMLCLCDCGNEKAIQLRSLRSGNTRSCGCLVGRSSRGAKGGEKPLSQKNRDFTGERFGRLTAIRRVGERGPNRLMLPMGMANEDVSEVLVNWLRQWHPDHKT